MDSPASLLTLPAKASFSTRSFARTTWRETWTFRRFVPIPSSTRAAISTGARTPLGRLVVRLRA